MCLGMVASSCPQPIVAADFGIASGDSAYPIAYTTVGATVLFDTVYLDAGPGSGCWSFCVGG